MSSAVQARSHPFEAFCENEHAAYATVVAMCELALAGHAEDPRALSEPTDPFDSRTVYGAICMLDTVRRQLDLDIRFVGEVLRPRPDGTGTTN